MMRFRNFLPCLMLCWACDSSDDKQNTDKVNHYGEKTDKQSFSAAVILDGMALTQTWQRFFGVKTDILNAHQQHALGNLNYTASDSMLRNGRRLREINQSYVKTLREVLLQLCQTKTRQEIKSIGCQQARRCL